MVLLHQLPACSSSLEYLEQKFSGENSIVFIGCHSAKFKNEKSSEKVRDAILKYDIKHPVINDAKCSFGRVLSATPGPV